MGLVTKNGTGTWTLNGANLYTGATTVNEGTLKLAASSSLSASTAITVAQGTLDFGGNSQTVLSLTLGGATAVSGSTANIIGNGTTLTLGGNVTYTATTNPLGGFISTNLALGAAARTFSVADSTATFQDLVISGVVSGTIAAQAAGFNKTGAGTLFLNNTNNSFDTGITVAGGVLQFLTIGNAAGGNTSLGNPTAGTNATITLNTGTLYQTGSAASSSSRPIALTGAGVVDASSSGALTLSGGVTGAFGLTLQGTGSATESGQHCGGTTLTKQGSGTWTLTNATGQTYNGATTVNNGTLIGTATATASAGAFGFNDTPAAINLVGGTLRLNAASATTTTTSAGALTSTAGTLIVDGTNAPANTTTINFTAGGVNPSLVRGTAGTLVVVPVTASLTAAGHEQVTFGATAPANTAAGILSPWVVAEASGVNSAGDFTAMSGANLIAYTGYTTLAADASAGSNATVYSALVNTAVGANRAVFALKADTATVSGACTLTVGPTVAGPAGIILNNGCSIIDEAPRRADYRGQ